MSRRTRAAQTALSADRALQESGEKCAQIAQIRVQNGNLRTLIARTGSAAAGSVASAGAVSVELLGDADVAEV